MAIAGGWQGCAAAICLSVAVVARAVLGGGRKDRIRFPALEVQTPWSRKLLRGHKLIETRAYPLDEDLVGRKIWIIETDGKDKVSPLTDDVLPGGARLVGTITFSAVKEYVTRGEWEADMPKHLVEPQSLYAWQQGRPTFGWVVATVQEFPRPVDIPAATRVFRSIFTLGSRPRSS